MIIAGHKRQNKKDKIQVVYLQMLKEREVPYSNAYIDSPETAAQMRKDIVSSMLCGRWCLF